MEQRVIQDICETPPQPSSNPLWSGVLPAACGLCIGFCESGMVLAERRFGGMRIEDIRELLRRYPVVAEVPLEQPEEFTRAGMVRVKFHGDKEVGMALGLFDQRPGESRQEWKERLDHIVNG